MNLQVTDFQRNVRTCPVCQLLNILLYFQGLYCKNKISSLFFAFVFMYYAFCMYVCTYVFYVKSTILLYELVLLPLRARGLGLPRWLSGKESSGNAGDAGLITGSGRSPGKGKWQPTPVFLPGESHGQRSLAGYSPWGCKELDTTE